MYRVVYGRGAWWGIPGWVYLSPRVLGGYKNRLNPLSFGSWEAIKQG